jgi:hypothetical protein
LASWENAIGSRILPSNRHICASRLKYSAPVHAAWLGAPPFLCLSY